MKKHRGLGLVAALALVAGLLPLQAFGPVETAQAASSTSNTATNYYKTNLDVSEYPTSKALYETLEGMDFASGESREVTDGDVLRQAEDYTNGDVALIKNFGAAIDSFKFDHSEIFYVNWDNVSVNVYRTAAGTFRVEVGPGRTDSYYLDPSATEDSIRGQISEYEGALDAIASQVTGTDAKSIASSAAQKIGEQCTYSFYDKVEYDGSRQQTDPAEGADKAPVSTYIHTAYGAAVNGFCVCEGYSRLFKQVMDRKGVNTELVQGNFIDGESFEPHMWNHVEDENGDWYGVDVTALDGHSPNERPINAASTFDKYFWRTSETFGLNHQACAAISSVQYPMPYPELKDFWITPTWSGRFECGTGSYDASYPNAFWFSYNGKSAKKLREEDGLYMALHMAVTNRGIREVSDWQSIEQWQKMFGLDYLVDDKDGTRTWFLGYNISCEFYEVGIFDIVDDVKTSDDPRADIWKYTDNAIKSHLLETSYINNPYWNPDYRKTPYIEYGNTSPEGLFQRRQDILKPIHCDIAYDTELKLVDSGKVDSEGNLALDLDYYVTSYNNSDLNAEVVKRFAKLENATLTNVGGKGVISFDFTPSRQYNHNMIWYNFVPKNAVSVLPEVTDENRVEASKYSLIYPDGVPVPQFTLVFSYSDQTACPNVYSDGRLWVNTYAQPTLVSTSDLSLEGWEYETFDDSGNVVKKAVSQGQRSQLALVVTSPQDADAVEESATSYLSNGEEAVLASKTYEIDFNICGKNPVIPDGSYVNVNLGIPDSEFKKLMESGSSNVTFQLFHFKKKEDTIVRDGSGKIVSYELDYDNPEVIPCTLTQYGLIAKIRSFSPFVLMAIDKTQLTEEESAEMVARTVTAQSNGNGAGGALGISGSETLSKPDDKVTYTFTPEDGYQLEFVKLNGVELEIEGDSITLEYGELRDSNTLTYGFVSTAVKEAERQKGLELVLSPSTDSEGEGGGASGSEEHAHLWNAGTPDPAATCTTPGVMKHACAVSGCTQTKEEAYTDPGAHNYGQTFTVAPTCTSQGYDVQTCSLCGNERKWAYKEALGHRQGSLVSAEVPPTCTSEGRSAVYDCIDHDARLGGGTIPKIAHDIKVTREILPTCELPGQTELRECRNCSFKEGGVSMPPRGHAYSNPNWVWSSDYTGAFVVMTCERDATHSYKIDADVKKDDSNPEKGVIYTATANSQDGDVLADAVLLSKSGAVVRGDAVKDGFEAQLYGSPAGKTAQIGSNRVTWGNVYEALVQNAANNSLGGEVAGVFEVNLAFSDNPGESVHNKFGSLDLTFPVDSKYNGRYAIIHHCHANDMSNITIHSDYLVADGKVKVDGITDLSTFAVEIAPESYKPTATGGQPVTNAVPASQNLGSGALAKTGDEKRAGLLAAIAIAGLASALSLGMTSRRTRKS